MIAIIILSVIVVAQGYIIWRCSKTNKQLHENLRQFRYLAPTKCVNHTNLFFGRKTMAQLLALMLMMQEKDTKYINSEKIAKKVHYIVDIYTATINKLNNGNEESDD